ncbi:hypothetical protein Pfo_007919 [Paulownia fortunei]|nr:hypothetical protein Pfo_007919 [Paulownia fortunei]
MEKSVGTKSGLVCDSPSVSRTLGDVDSETDSLQSSFWKETIADVLEKNSQKNEDKVFVKSPMKTEIPKAPWLDLFKDNRNVSYGIKLNAVETNDADEVILEAHDLDKVEEAWGFCFVGYFATKFPSKTALIQLYDSWNVKYKYFAHSSGWLVFKFDNTMDRDKVLNGGPYFFDDDEIRTVPVWINLPGLPLECWNSMELSKIASKVGKSISTDKLTHTKKRLSYARVLVEVDAAKELIRTIKIKLPNGKNMEQQVVFEFEPKYCENCKTLGHPTGACFVRKTVKGHREQLKIDVRKPSTAMEKAKTAVQGQTSATQLSKDEEVETVLQQHAEKQGTFQAVQGAAPLEVPYTLVAKKNKRSKETCEPPQHIGSDFLDSGSDGKTSRKDKGKTLMQHIIPKVKDKKKSHALLISKCKSQLGILGA